jgi:O-antigen ligase
MNASVPLIVWLAASLAMQAGGDPRSLWMLAPLAGLVLAVSLQRDRPTPRAIARACVVTALFGGFVLLQAVNASHVWTSETGHLLARRHITWLPHSVHAGATLIALARYALVAGAFIVASRLVRPEERQRFRGMLVAGGFVLAVGAMLLRPADGSARQPMGPFGNENHFAAYMNLLIPIGLGLGAELNRARHTRGNNPAYLIYFAVGCMAAAVAVSESRAGILIAAALLLAWTLTEWRRVSVGGNRALRLWLPLALCAVLVASFAAPLLARQWDSLRGPGLRLAVEHRLLIWSGAWRMALDHRASGIGAGAFADAFPYYQPDALAGVVVRAAHNDWIQAAAELGAPGLILLAIVLATALSPLARSGPTDADGRTRTAVLLALGGLAVHAAVDFPLTIPAIPLLAATLAGLACAGAPPSVSRAGSGVC